MFSYVLHRRYTFRSDPFVRWVRMPVAFVGVATVAALVDVIVLRSVFAARGFDTTPALIAAKLVALAVAAVVRLVLYRAILLQAVRHRLHEQVPRPPAPGAVRATVVIPALDEAARIGRTITAVRAALADVAANGGLEIVVVDDGSTDATADAALEAGADQVVVLPANRGKGAAVRAGVAAARGRTIAFTDADLAYSPDQVLRVVAEVEAGWDVAIGSRRHPDATRVQGAGVLRDLGSRAVNLLATAVLLEPPARHPVRAQGLPLRRRQAGVRRSGGWIASPSTSRCSTSSSGTAGPWRRSPCRSRWGSAPPCGSCATPLRLLRDLWRIRHWSATGAYELPEGTTTPAVAQTAT